MGRRPGPVASAAGLVLAAAGLVWALRTGGSVAVPGSGSRGPAPISGPVAVDEVERPGGVPEGAQAARVARVLDGDTFRVDALAGGGNVAEGDEHRVRLLEIDAPEMSGPGGRRQYWAVEATAFLRSALPEGSRVWLQADREDRDSYGRFLRYAWNDRGRFVNLDAVAGGHARAVLFPPNDRYIAEMRRAEAEARRGGRGLWGACAG